MSTEKIQTGTRLEYEMLRKISVIAKQNRRSMNAQIEFLVQQCIEDYEREHGSIDIAEQSK